MSGTHRARAVAGAFALAASMTTMTTMSTTRPAAAKEGIADNGGSYCQARAVFTSNTQQINAVSFDAGPIYAVDLVDHHLQPILPPGPGTELTLTCSVQLDDPSVATPDIGSATVESPVPGVVAMAEQATLTQSITQFSDVYVCSSVSWVDPDGFAQTYDNDIDLETSGVQCAPANLVGTMRSRAPRLGGVTSDG